MTHDQGGLEKFSRLTIREANAIRSTRPPQTTSSRLDRDRTVIADVAPFRLVLQDVAKLTQSVKPTDELLIEMANLQSQFAVYVFGETLLPWRQLPPKKRPTKK